MSQEGVKLNRIEDERAPCKNHGFDGNDDCLDLCIQDYIKIKPKEEELGPCPDHGFPLKRGMLKKFPSRVMCRECAARF